MHSILNGVNGNKANSTEGSDGNASTSLLKDQVEYNMKQNEYEQLLNEIAAAEEALAEEEKAYEMEQAQYKSQVDILPVLAGVYDDELNEINYSLTSAHATLQDELLGNYEYGMCILL